MVRLLQPEFTLFAPSYVQILKVIFIYIFFNFYIYICFNYLIFLGILENFVDSIYFFLDWVEILYVFI